MFLIVFAVIQERGSPFRTSGPGRRRPRCNPGSQFSPLLRWPVDMHCIALYLPTFVITYHKVQIADTHFNDSIDRFLSQRECDMTWYTMGDGNSITAIMARAIPLRQPYRSVLYYI